MGAVAVFSDASVCQESTAAAWGACGVKDGERVFEYGSVLSYPLLDTTVAEALAAFNCIKYAFERGYVDGEDAVTLYTDCRQLVSVYNGHAVQPNLTHPAWAIERFVNDNHLNLTMKHVQGHFMGPNRTWLHDCQNKCDEIAREIMRSVRSAMGFSLTPRVPELRLDIA